MGKVYVVQENPKVNVIGAARFGELIPLLRPGTQITLSSSPVVHSLRIKLKDFSDEDYLLAMGDPAAIAIASMVASEINNGFVNILKWDRENHAYYNVEIDLFKRKEKDV
tara:strand:+ start:912 stop:1241 length:330 start_codon:yes stop_codon:yes gene_type:complete